MALISLPRTVLSFQQDTHFLSNTTFPSKLPLQNSQFCSSKAIQCTSKAPKKTALGVSPNTKESLPSIDTQLEKQQKPKKKDQSEPDVAKVWRKIQGQDDWKGLLDPMDPILRSELIRYGEMAQACYDAFNCDPYSKYCGSCIFEPDRFFESLGMTDCGYNVTKYLYPATRETNINFASWISKPRWPILWSNANWMGYVAVSDDETSKRLGRRDIVVAWRGTTMKLEWVADATSNLKPVTDEKIPCPDPTVKAECGFLTVYTDKDETCRFCEYSAREQLLVELKSLTEKYAKEEEVSITIIGHSLGSALATLSAYDIAETGLNVMPDRRALPVTVFSFAGPRVGNLGFKKRIEELGVRVLRMVNVYDVVPKVPGVFWNENLMIPIASKLVERLPWVYTHVGVELQLDQFLSPYLRREIDAGGSHDLEVYLHLLDGYHGKGQEFELASGRDPALVNKAADVLKDNYFIPGSWKQEEHKGLVKNQDGRWERPDRPVIPIPDHPTDMLQRLGKLGLRPVD